MKSNDVFRQGRIGVLFVHFGEDWIRGSETVLLDLLANLDRSIFEPFVWCNSAALLDACRSLRVTTYRSDFVCYFDYNSPPFSPRRYAALLSEGCALVRRHDIGVLHANGAAPAQWLVPIGHLTRRRVLAHLHIGYLRRSRYATLLHAVDLVVGVSGHVTEGLLVDGIKPARIKVIHNGVDMRRLPPSATDLRTTLAIPATATVVSTIGSLIPRKGHDVLLRAFAKLPCAAAPPHLLLGGDGEAMADLEALANGLGVSDRVHFLGYAGDVAAIYQASDIFALASRNESFGLVLAEAACFGLPVVATRVGGIPEVVSDGETGLLVPPDDVAAMAGALSALVADSSLRERLGAAGCRRVAAQFNTHGMTMAIEECWKQLSSGPPPRPLPLRVFPHLAPYARLLAKRVPTTKPASP